jgi:hypothetical protein
VGEACSLCTQYLYFERSEAGGLGACPHEHEKYERAQVIKWWGVELENAEPDSLLA